MGESSDVYQKDLKKQKTNFKKNFLFKEEGWVIQQLQVPNCLFSLAFLHQLTQHMMADLPLPLSVFFLGSTPWCTRPSAVLSSPWSVCSVNKNKSEHETYLAEYVQILNQSSGL